MKENKKQQIDELISVNAGTSALLEGDDSSFSELKTPPTNNNNPQYITPTQGGGGGALAQQKKMNAPQSMNH
jgi:hypothetical protein